MPISIREHCIPSYDALARLRRVAPIPAELDSMEEKTAGGIVNKVWAVVNSDYFKSLPASKVIQSGATPEYYWDKQVAEAEMRQIYNECKDSL